MAESDRQIRRGGTLLAGGGVYLDNKGWGFPPGMPRPPRPWVGGSYEVVPGGSMVNFARIGASLGLPITVVGKVGQDMYGAEIQRQLARQKNLETAFITSPDVQTNLGQHNRSVDGIEVRANLGDASQSLTIVDLIGAANDSLRKANNDMPLGYFYSGGVLKLPQLLNDGLPFLFAGLRSAGVNVILDHGNVPPDLTDEHKRHLHNAIRHVDYYFPSREEFLDLWDVTSIEEGITKVRDFAKHTNIIVKDEENGAIGAMSAESLADAKHIPYPDGIVRVGAFDVSVIDQVGAGDSFNAGFIYALYNDYSFEDCIRFGSATAAWRISNSALNTPTADQIRETMRLPLLKPRVETAVTPEKQRTVENAYMFDIDGVITDPVTHKIVHPEIIDIIADKLKSGEPVALNTGRAMERAQPVIDAILERFAEDKTGLANLTVIAEFGGSWASFDKKGNMQVDTMDISVPQNLVQQVNDLVDKRFSDWMSIHSTKKTMLSVTKDEHTDLPTFKAKQAELVALLEDMVKEFGYEVQTDTSAINILNSQLGKDVGVTRWLQNLHERGINPNAFKVFGDSLTDLKMLKEFRRRGMEIEYYHVGLLDEETLRGLITNEIMDEIGLKVVGGNDTGVLRILKDLSMGSSSQSDTQQSDDTI